MNKQELLKGLSEEQLASISGGVCSLTSSAPDYPTKIYGA